MSDPYRPLFIEVPREEPARRFGVLDMTGLAPMCKALYPAPAHQDSARPMSGETPT